MKTFVPKCGSEVLELPTELLDEVPGSIYVLASSKNNYNRIEMKGHFTYFNYVN